MLVGGARRQYSQGVLRTHLFAFIQERLKQDGLPSALPRKMVLWLPSGTRFDSESPYTLGNVHPEQAFEVKGAGRIGFQDAHE